MEETIVFVDAGFLSKLSKYFGGGKYLKYDLIKFCEEISRKQSLICKKIFYYTAPPFQPTNPTKEESERKDKYDRFIKKISQNQKINVREGRCQKLFNKDGYSNYFQKAVDSLIVIYLMSLPIKNKEIKKIILIACDSDLVPVIDELKNYNIDSILYTFFTKKRDTNFSRSTHLMGAVSRYVKLTKNDFDFPLK